MNIRPLGEQIIIRTIPLSEVGSIIIPDSAKGITMLGDKGASDAVHFVEAEVVAVGPGKRSKGDPTLVEDMAEVLRIFLREDEDGTAEGVPSDILNELVERADNPQLRIPPQVKPGDRILYHPAVQRFDREITDLMNNEGLNDPTIQQPEAASGSRWFIIREESVLGILDPEL